MAQSTGIVLAAAGISFANEWLDTGKPNFRIIVAGLAVSLLFDGIEKLSPEAAMGLATITLITVLVTPFNGKSPAQTVAGLAVAKPQAATPASIPATQTVVQ